jgi:glycine/D-amino acid oxidase-like deaminating enzyme
LLLDCQDRALQVADHMTNNPVVIAGGGIGGLATALTLHQIGVPCVVFEAVRDMRPLEASAWTCNPTRCGSSTTSASRKPISIRVGRPLAADDERLASPRLMH